MIPQNAVVCAAHTDLGKHVVRNLLRFPHIGHIYALSELDIRDELSNHAQAMHKLTLLVQPLDYLERTIAAYVTKADLAFCCLCSPRHAVPSLGAYLFHKLNFDIPLRFLHEMTRLSAHSVALFAHPAAMPNARSQFLRVKGELMEAARNLQETTFPDVPRIVFLLVPTLISHVKRPHIHHATDHAYNGVLPRPLSALDRLKQRAVLKHDPDVVRPLLARDVAAAMVADAIDSVNTISRDDTTALRLRAELFITLDPPRIMDLARTARAIRSARQTETRDRAAMRRKASPFARANAGDGDDVGITSTSASSSRRGRGGVSDVSSPTSHVGRRGRAVAPPVHSARALGDQLSRQLTAVRDNDVLPDAAPRLARARSHHHGADSRSRQVDSRLHRSRSSTRVRDAVASSTMDRGTTPPLLSPPVPSTPRRPSASHGQAHARSRTSSRRLASSRSFHAGDRVARFDSMHHGADDDNGEEEDNAFYVGDGDEVGVDDDSDSDAVVTRYESAVSTYSARSRRSRPGLLATIAGKVLSATERPSTRRAREARSARRSVREPRSLRAQQDLHVRGGGDMRAIGQTTI